VASAAESPTFLGAEVGLAHAILVIIWHLLEHACSHVDLGTNDFDEHDRREVARRHVTSTLVGRLGYQFAP